MIPFNEATKGHTLAVDKPKKQVSSTWRIRCSCGWEEKRPKTGGTLEPMAAFKSRGDRHLYGVWQEAQQGRLL